MSYFYIEKKPNPYNPSEMMEEKKELVIETRVESFIDNPDILNPTGDETAYFYAIAIDGGREQFTTFQPGEEWYQPMTEEEANSFLAWDIKQLLLNFNAYAE